MAPIVYKFNMSAPCRAVLLVAKALELEIEEKDVDLIKREHLEADFVEMNPQHAIPVLDDDGYILCDSHSILCYLVTKYGADDSLYPSDPQERGLINHKLFFNAASLQTLMRQITAPIIFGGERSVSEALVDKANEVYGTLETFLQDREWLVTDNVTIADLALIPSVTTLNILVPIDTDVYSKLGEWIARVEELPYYEANSSGLEEFKMMYDTIMNS